MIGFDDYDDYEDDWYSGVANKEAYEEIGRIRSEIFPPGSEIVPLHAREQYKTVVRRLRRMKLSRCSSGFRNAFDDYVAELETFAETWPTAGDAVTTVVTSIIAGFAALPMHVANYLNQRASAKRLDAKRRRLNELAHP
ncbi:MAG TPA: hypothetical protein VF710_01505 [Longimicrobium sp.]|jgi:hypothetical protein